MKDTKTCAIFDLDGTIIRLSSEQVFLRYLLSHGEIPIPNLLAWVSYLLRVKSLRAAKPNKIYLRGLEQTHVHEIARRCFTETLRPSIAPHISELIHHIAPKNGQLSSCRVRCLFSFSRFMPTSRPI